MRRYLFPMILGLGGIAILMSLGFWQLRRLEWKAGILAAIEARIADTPVVLDALPPLDPERDQYQPVLVAGTTTGQDLRVLSGQKGIGAGYEIIAAFVTDGGRRILIDRGYVPEAEDTSARSPVRIEARGNLMWPREADSFTPPPDQGRNLWFARDVTAMAAALGTDPVMVVLAEPGADPQGISPVPVGMAGIPNDHLNYAITWFSLAAVWAGMTGYLLWRIRRRRD